MSTSWNEIAKFFRTEPSLAGEITANMSGMSDIDLETVKLWDKGCCYQGFNVKEFMVILMKHYTAYTEAGHATVTYKVEFRSGGTDQSFEYTNSKSFMHDMCFLILLFLQRGSAWDKIVKKSNPKVAEIMNMLKEKYNISTDIRKAGTSLDPEIITIPRIASCFPTRLLKFLSDDVGRILVDVAVLSEVEVPRWMKHPSAICGFPAPTILETVKTAKLFCFGVSVLTDDLLHKKDGKYTGFSDMISYFEAAMNTPAVPDVARRRFLKEMGLYELRNGAWSPTTAFPNLDREALLTNILALRPNDANHGSVRDLIARL